MSWDYLKQNVASILKSISSVAFITKRNNKMGMPHKVKYEAISLHNIADVVNNSPSFRK